MRWLITTVLLSVSGCQCARTVDETAKKTAHEVTGAGTVERGKRVQKKIESALKNAEKARDDRAAEILEGVE